MAPKAMEGLTVKPGEVLFKEGEESKEIYILLQGRVTLKKGLSVVEELTMDGSVFGEMAALRNTPREVTAITNTKTVVMVIRDLAAAIQQMPSTGLQLAKALARQLVKVNKMQVKAQEQLRRCKAEYQRIIKGLEEIYGTATEFPRIGEIIEESKKSIFAERDRSNLMVYQPSSEGLRDEQKERQRRYKRGEILFRENDTSKEVYIVLEGELGVRVGDKMVATIDGKGSFVGDMSILRNEPRSATIEVIKDATLMVIEDLEAAIGKTPTIGIKLAQTLANRVHNTSEGANEYRKQLTDCRVKFQETVEELIGIYRKYTRLPQLLEIIEEANNSIFMKGGR